ncbi:hypothetical protein BpHYR1_021769 [Brachionus plicatilis]|uniref:Uncharacterized protein n=1 Tax=Brachionus plicatilis TaxID=10195 RepID=A0A3M7QWG8_BRAPC|nr:hypothetical protein BpHYR1_021769 [Brachionus plicatilis]
MGVSPKCVSSTKKRYEETASVSDRSRSDESNFEVFNRKSRVILKSFTRNSVYQGYKTVEGQQIDDR